MKTQWQRSLSIASVFAFAMMAFFLVGGNTKLENRTFAQAAPTPTPAVAEFDQKAAIAKLREQIKGKENDLAPTVFKNIQTMKNTPSGRLLAVMEFGYARSLGVNCAHCHVPDKWESDDKKQKQVARDMSTMVTTINKDLIKNIKNLTSANPIVNCTTCHRGQIIPATNLPPPPKTE